MVDNSIRRTCNAIIRGSYVGSGYSGRTGWFTTGNRTAAKVAAPGQQ